MGQISMEKFCLPKSLLSGNDTENHLADASVDPYAGCEPNKANYCFKWLSPERK